MRIAQYFVSATLLLAIPAAFANGGNLWKAQQPTQKTTTAHHTVSATFRSGSLRYNIDKIARKFGWSNVKWQVPNDYKWIGTTTVRADDLVGIFNQVLAKYPVQAQFYEANHILVIVPRTL